jgi:hypothetical protein
MVVHYCGKEANIFKIRIIINNLNNAFQLQSRLPLPINKGDEIPLLRMKLNFCTGWTIWTTIYMKLQILTEKILHVTFSDFAED